MKSQEKLVFFAQEFNGFHDSIVKEIRISNTEYIDSDGVGHGHAEGLHFNADFLFQRLAIGSPDSVQVSFKGVIAFHITSPPKGASSEIGSAELKLLDGNVYFGTDEDWRANETDPPSIWIIARSVDWFREDGQLGKRAVTRTPEPVDY